MHPQSFKLDRKFLFLFVLCLALNFLAPSIAIADDDMDEPPHLEFMMEIEAESEFDPEDFSLEIRKEAIKEAALSYGARGGLSQRTYEIRQDLERQTDALDRIYDFRSLLIKAPSGLLMEPPIVSESQNNLLVNATGQEAAISDLIYQINAPAKFVTAPRNWRTYLERQWSEVPAPPDLLLPQNAIERKNWRKWVKKGWEEGYQMGEEIFQTDLDRLVTDYTGMVRYRVLLSQNMISPPFALEQDRGITGGGSKLRVGDRAVTITGPSQLKAGGNEWQPADR